MKSLFKNSIYNVIYRLVSLLFPLVSSAYVSRILLADGVGKVSLAQNFVSYFIVIAGLGLANYGVREIGISQKKKLKYSKIFIELIIISFISTLICSLIYYYIVFSNEIFYENRVLYFAVGVQLILNSINIDWFFQGMEEYGYITARSLIVKVVVMISMFFLVRSREDVVSYALLTSLAIAGNNIFNIIHVRKYIVINRSIIKKLNIVRHIKPLIILLSTSITVELYTKLDITMLGIMSSEENVGYYAYAVKIISIVVNIAATASVILLPRLSYYYKNNNIIQFNKTVNNAYRILFVLTLPMTIGLILVSSPVVNILFGESFYPASITVKILSILVFIKAIGNLFGTQVLLTVGQEKKLFITTLIGAITNIIFNLSMIPIWGENGAALASVISEFLVLLVQVYYAKRYVSFKIDKRICISTIISTIFMIIIVISSKKIINNELIGFLTSIILGGITYVISNILLKNKVVIDILLNIKKIRR